MKPLPHEGFETSIGFQILSTFFGDFEQAWVRIAVFTDSTKQLFHLQENQIMLQLAEA
jgi:hypothetical protein